MIAFDLVRGEWKKKDGKKDVLTCGEVALYPEEAARVDASASVKNEGLVLCEGEIDALSAWQAGFAAVTFTCGAKGANNKPELIERLLVLPGSAGGVTLLYDGDADGRKGAEVVARMIAEGGGRARIGALPDGQDVNDVYRQGGSEALRRVICATQPYTWHDQERKAEGADDDENPLLLDRAPPIHPDVYALALLPPVLAETASTFRLGHERDLYLSAALAAISACLPNVAGEYGDSPVPLRPSFYVCGVAGAASGKGVAKWGERLVGPVDEVLREEARAAHAAWEAQRRQAEEAGEPFEEPEPPKTGSLILPANASAAAFHKALADRDGRALAFETEIDTLFNALGREWGKYDDTLRKAYHHERVSYLRKGEEVSIAEPTLALVLTGTESQARRLFPTSEHGTYSRFAIYYFEPSLTWIDQRPTAEAAQRRKLFDRWGGEVLRLFQALRERRSVLLFELTPEHWDQQRNTFAPMMKRLSKAGATHLSDVVKRAGVTAFRVTMVLRLLRAFCDGESLGDDVTCLRATDADVEAALWLACTWCDHAIRFGLTLHEQPTPHPADERLRRLLPQLGERFATHEMRAAAHDLGIEVVERTTQRDLERAIELGWIRKMKKGGWEQIDDRALDVRMSDVSDRVKVQ